MRYIKFRVWNGIEEVLSDVFELSDLITANLNNTFPSYDPSEYIIMQYTGLEDKNGVEIYEGDVVDWLGDKFKIIIYCATAWCVTETSQQSLYEIDDTEIEIIGNIYENPELLPK